MDGEPALHLVDTLAPRMWRAQGSAVGFHGGADVARFFSRYFGVGGTVLLNHGTVSMDEPFAGQSITLRAGRVKWGGGVRIRY